MWSWIMNTVIRYINHFLINLVVYENVSTINKRGKQKREQKLFFHLKVFVVPRLFFGLLGFLAFY